MPMDYKKYHQNWKEISAWTRIKAGNKCELCDAKNGEPHPITKSKVVLTVHHLNFNTKNNEEYNLMALCQRCHNRLDVKKRVWNRRNRK